MNAWKKDYRHSLSSLVFLAGIAAATSMALPAEADDRWVATWATAPLGDEIENDTLYLRDFYPMPRAIKDQTIRQVVRTSIGGDQVRVRLSNLVARIPMGATLWSDPVDLEVGDNLDLAISLYVAKETVVKTIHGDANSTSYVSETGDALPPNFAGCDRLWGYPGGRTSSKPSVTTQNPSFSAPLGFVWS